MQWRQRTAVSLQRSYGFSESKRVLASKGAGAARTRTGWLALAASALMAAAAEAEATGAVALTATSDWTCDERARVGAADTADVSRMRTPVPGKVKLPAANPSVVATSVITIVTDALRHVAGRLRGAAKGSVPGTVTDWFELDATPI